MRHITKQNHLLTLDETLRDQENLNKLCEDRPLKTEEIFRLNAYYGFDYLIKTYANIPLDNSLKAFFPHAVPLPNTPILTAKNAPLSIFYYYSSRTKKIYSKNTQKIAFGTPCPFIYIKEFLKNQPRPQRKGTIFFLSHSTRYITTLADFEKIAYNLEKLDNHHKPISICIYWKDYILGHHKIFNKKGFKIVSAGHIFDPFFLFRLYHLCSMHKFAASNELGSHLFYSVNTGCSFFFVNSGEIQRTAPKEILDHAFNPKNPETEKNLKRLFAEPQDELTSEQINIVDELLGTKYLKSPKALKEELMFADKLYTFGIARHPENKKIYFGIPYYFFPKKFIRHMKKVATERNHK